MRGGNDMGYTKKKKEKDEFDYHIEKIIGTISSNEKTLWGKYVCVARNSDNPTTVDIRHLKKESGDDENVLIGKGMSLSGFEVDVLTDILVSNGYGTTQVLEDEIERRKRMYGLENKEEETEEN
jgi:hypothetical protein